MQLYNIRFRYDDPPQCVRVYLPVVPIKGDFVDVGDKTTTLMVDCRKFCVDDPGVIEISLVPFAGEGSACCVKLEWRK